MTVWSERTSILQQGAVSTEEEEEDTSTAVLDHVSKALNQNLDVWVHRAR